MTKSETDRIYYVYAYINPVSQLPFYIGKGKGKRKLFHLREALNGRDKGSCILEVKKLLESEILPEIFVLKDGLTEWEAFDFEKQLIADWGRKELGTGPLCNLTDGGDGLRGLSYEFQRESIRNLWKDPDFKKRVVCALKQAWKDEEKRRLFSEKMKIICGTEESRKKNSESKKGRIGAMTNYTQTKETRALMSKSRKEFLLCNPAALEEIRLRLKILNEKERRPHTEEEKAHQKVKMEEWWASSEVKERRRKSIVSNPNYGMRNKYHKEDSIRIMSIKGKEKWEDPNYRVEMSIKMKAGWTKEKREAKSLAMKVMYRDRKNQV